MQFSKPLQCNMSISRKRVTRGTSTIFIKPTPGQPQWEGNIYDVFNRFLPFKNFIEMNSSYKYTYVWLHKIICSRESEIIIYVYE